MVVKAMKIRIGLNGTDGKKQVSPAHEERITNYSLSDLKEERGNDPEPLRILRG